MEIEKKGNFIFFVDLDDQILDSLNLRKILYVFGVEVAVQVLTENSGSVVAKKNAVWIDHRHYEEDVVLGEDGSVEYFWYKILESPVWHCFAGMRSC